MRSETVQTVVKPRVTSRKVLLCIWWDCCWHALNVLVDHGLQHLRDVALAIQCTENEFYRDAALKPNTNPSLDSGYRSTVAMHNAAVKQPLTTVSPNWNTTIVMLKSEVVIVSKRKVLPFRNPYLPFISSLAAQTPVVSSQRNMKQWTPCGHSFCW
ncbi:hypothetical protein TNCV_4363401 [Trichonephila clavipes]|nr:hypothetical protein TNCV_4363401 [Trichonephila clavipes]